MSDALEDITQAHTITTAETIENITDFAPCPRLFLVLKRTHNPEAELRYKYRDNYRC
jgi:hypothetical protein